MTSTLTDTRFVVNEPEVQWDINRQAWLIVVRIFVPEIGKTYDYARLSLQDDIHESYAAWVKEDALYAARRRIVPILKSIDRHKRRRWSTN